MNNDIKEILDRLERIDHKEYQTAFEFADSATFDEMARCFKERMIMADYITNLQEELEEEKRIEQEDLKTINNLEERIGTTKIEISELMSRYFYEKDFCIEDFHLDKLLKTLDGEDKE